MDDKYQKALQRYLASLDGGSITIISPDYRTPQQREEEKQEALAKEAETKQKFKDLLAGSGIKKQLSVGDQIKHKYTLGPLEEYKAQADENNKRLCGVCGDPMCPWSD